VFKQKQVRHSNRKLLIHDRYVVAPFYKKMLCWFQFIKMVVMVCFITQKGG